MSLKDKSVIVTGGGSGIGKAAAIQLAAAGSHVTIGDVNEAGATETLHLIEAAGGRVQFVKTSVADEDQVIALVQAAVTTYGKLDGAINAAGVAQKGEPLHLLTAADFDRVHGVNLRGMFFCFKHQIAAMLDNGGGSIVAIGAIAGRNGVPNSSEYGAAKNGINGLVRCAAIDYATQGIRVNAVLPGGTWTPMVQGSLAKDPALQRVVDTFPMKRFAQPEEISAAAVFLISDAASYTTGACIPVDGALSVI